MNIPKLAAANGAGFFCFWLLVLYAGADHPPPPGFLWLVLLLVLCALLVTWRVPRYIEWHLSGQQRHLLRVLLEGFSAGIGAGMIALLFSFSDGGYGGEPSVTPTEIDILLWLAVLGIVGLLNALFIYGANAFIANRLVRYETGR